jgi:DNA-binding winged helix-turn-helix (wHTH) protein
MEAPVSDAQIKIAQDGDLEPLLKLLRHADEGVRGLAAKAVGSLVYHDSEVVLKGPGGYAPFLEMVKHRDDEVRSKAIWTIAILASNEENQSEVIKQIGWDVIMALIKDTVVEVQCGGVTLLGNLALLRDNKLQIINKGGVDVLVTLLKETRDVIVKRAIVTALSNIVDSDNAIEVIDDDALDQLLSLLEKTDDERLLSGIVHTISSIANSENKKMNKKITKQGLDRLIFLLRSQSDVVQKGTIMVFNGLSSSTTFQGSLFSKGAVKVMLELLQDSDDEELILGLILCINNLSQNDSNHNELLEIGVQDVLLTLFDKSSNGDIKRECAEALSGLSGPVRSVNRSRPRSRSSPLRSDGTGVKDNVKQIVKMLIKDPSLQRKLQKMGVVPQLIALLRKEQTDELKGHALDALTLIAMNNSFNQQNIALSNDSNGIR